MMRYRPPTISPEANRGGWLLCTMLKVSPGYGTCPYLLVVWRCKRTGRGEIALAPTRRRWLRTLPAPRTQVERPGRRGGFAAAALLAFLGFTPNPWPLRVPLLSLASSSMSAKSSDERH